MLDIRLIRDDPDSVRKMLASRGMDYPIDDVLAMDNERRKLITDSQRLKRKRNEISQTISEIKRKAGDASGLIMEMRDVGRGIDEADGKVRELENKLHEHLLRIPNMLDPSVPIGPDASSNLVIHSRGDTGRTAPAKDHIELGETSDLIDLERAAKISGARFYFMKRDLVKLNYSIILFALDFMVTRGYTPVQPPYMINRAAMEGAIILSDFEDVIYKVEDEDLYLIGTSEHPLAAMHQNEIMEFGSLPRRYAGVSPCFRKEAGAHGRDTKGIFRVHQFEKVEQFVICEPDRSKEEHEAMRKNAEEFYQALELPYRVVALSSGDMGKVAAKTYDIEAYLPGQRAFREVVSCSNCTDYQARRLGIRFRRKPHAETEYVHTLNSTLVATERCIIAIMENFQKDKSIEIPKPLIPFMRSDRIELQREPE
jgi:seryl-tRNA synthetase